MVVPGNDTRPKITENTPIGTTNDNTPTANIQSNEDGYVIECSGDCTCSGHNNQEITANSSFDITLDEIADGTYWNCIVQINDTAGNIKSDFVLSVFTIDTTAPTSMPSAPRGVENQLAGITTTINVLIGKIKGFLNF